MEIKWWKKMVFPLQRLFFTGVASQFRFRTNGLLMLDQEVKACEYKDVHIMWEMLQKSDSDLARRPAKTKTKRVWKFLSWTRFAPCLGHINIPV